MLVIALVATLEQAAVAQQVMQETVAPAAYLQVEQTAQVRQDQAEAAVAAQAAQIPQQTIMAAQAAVLGY